MDDFKPRIKWSEFGYYEPMRIIISDWKSVKKIKAFNQDYFIVDSILEYKGRKIELCMPYFVFVSKLRRLPIAQQKLILEGRAILQIMKVPRRYSQGMIIQKVEEIPRIDYNISDTILDDSNQ